MIDPNIIKTRASEEWRMRLKQALDDRGLKYNEISVQADFHPEFVSRVLRGMLNPPVDRITRICEVANVKMAYLFADNPTKELEESMDYSEQLAEAEASLVQRLLASSRKD